MLCGEENVGPKIKGYSATVLTLHLLLLKITQNPRYQSITQEYYQSIQELPQNIKASLCWCQKNKHWALAKAMSIVGFGVNYPTAREGTLKILETMQIPVMNFDMEEFMHGPHRTIIKDSYIVLIDTDGCGKILMNNFIDFILFYSFINMFPSADNRNPIKIFSFFFFFCIPFIFPAVIISVNKMSA